MAINVNDSGMPIYPDSKNKFSFQSGLKFQDYVADLIRDELGIVITNYSSMAYQFGTGENKQGIEIKLDNDVTDTNKISIEIAEKSKASNSEYVPSGIYRNDNSWLYIQGNPKMIFIFSKNILRLLHRSGRYHDDTLATLKRFLMPIADARKYAAKVIEVNSDEEKLKKWNNGAS